MSNRSKFGYKLTYFGTKVKERGESIDLISGYSATISFRSIVSSSFWDEFYYVTVSV